MNLSSGITVLEIPSVKDKLNENQIQFWQRWIRALRSKNYNQSRSALRNLTGFSCIGVAADLLIKDKNLELAWGPLYCGAMPLMHKNNKMFLTVLPYSAMKKIGLLLELPTSSIGEEYKIITIDGLSYSLSQLNGNGASLEEIARILEIALEGGYRNKALMQ